MINSYNSPWASRHQIEWQTWKTQGTPPSCRNCHTSVLYSRFLVYFGGKEGDGRKRLVNDLHVFDIEQKQWLADLQVINEPPEARLGHTFELVDDIAIVYGGWNSSRVLSDCHILDFSLGMQRPKWFAVETQGVAPRRQFHTANTIDGRMFVFGGGDGKIWLNDLHCLHLKTLEWSVCATNGISPIGRLQHSTVTVGKKLIVFGGEPDRRRQLNDLHVLDTETMTWSQAECIGGCPAPTPRVSTTSVVNNSTIYFFGGYDGTTWLNDIHAFDTVHSQWVNPHVLLDGVPKPRCRHTSNIYKGNMLVFGGNDSDCSFNDLAVLRIERNP